MSIAVVSNQPLHMISTGAQTALGMNTPASAAAVRAGITRIAEHPFLRDREGAPIRIASVSYLPASMRVAERIETLALMAAREAIKPLQKCRAKTPRLPVIVALPASRPGLSVTLESTIQRAVTRAFTEYCPVLDIHTIRTGIAALDMAISKIQTGQSDLCLFGGCDSYISFDSLQWLSLTGCLHTMANRWGFVPGEAASFSLIASDQWIASQGIGSFAQILGTATSCEDNRIRTETICIGNGLSKAVAQAVSPLIGSREKVSHVYCDINGEPYRVDEWGFTIARLGKFFVDGSSYCSPANCWGDVGAASGPLLIGLAIEAARRRYAKGSHQLIWCSSESGERSAALLYTELAPTRTLSCLRP